MSTEKLKRVVRRTAGLLRKRGMRAAAARPFILLQDYLYDIRHKTDTTSWVGFKDLTVENNQIAGTRPYQPTRVLPLKKLLDKIAPDLPAGGVLLDIGCGKARVLLVASEYDFKTVRGIEFAKELCEIAKENCAKHKTRTNSRVNFEIVEGDAAKYRIGADENVFFMFNPFDEPILSRVMANIAESLETAPRRAVLICNNLLHPQVVDNSKHFRRQLDFDYHGYSFVVYANYTQSSAS